MKVAFLRPYHHLSNQPKANRLLHSAAPVVDQSFQSLSRANKVSGGNIGNFVHTEALTHIIEFDDANSAVLNVSMVSEMKGAKWLADLVNANFDVVIFSAANFIRPNVGFENEAIFFENLSIPFYVFGAGVQLLEDVSRSSLTNGMLRFLDVSNGNASIFATRGEATSEKLNALGMQNSIPTGCPSLYAFPESVFRISAPASSEDAKKTIITAGYLSAKGSPGARHEALERMFQSFPQRAVVDYIFQNELFWDEEKFAEVEGIYDIIDKSVSSNWVEKEFFKNFTSTRIDDFKYFTDTSSWRLFCREAEFYIGDRFHGGIICMQAGRPALIIYKDDRVRELATKNAIPSVGFDELEGLTYDRIISEYLADENISAMKLKIKQNFDYFIDLCISRRLRVRKDKMIVRNKTVESVLFN